MVDRRGFLLAGAAGALLAGCGGQDRASTQRRDDELTPTEVAADVELLNGLLQVEASAVAFYAGRGFPDVLAHERAHVARLEEAVRGLGGTAAGGDAGLRPDGPRALEETMVAAYLDTLPKLTSPRVRELVAGMAAVEAEHLAAVALAEDRPPAATAFVTGRRRA